MSKIILSAALLTMFSGVAFLAGGGCAATDDPSERLGDTTAALAEDGGVKRGEVVISQVYAAGGVATSAFKQDFVEIFNRSDRDIPLEGLSLRVAPASDDFAAGGKELSGSIPKGGYVLIALGGDPAGLGEKDLPTPDVDATLSLSLGPDGKVALALTSEPLNCGGTSRCGSKALDLVGYGGASDFEGADKVGKLNDPKKAALRKNGGCVDTDGPTGGNKADFTIGEAAPRTSSTEAAPCPPSGPGAPEAGTPFKDPALGAEGPYDAGRPRDAGGRPSDTSDDSGGCSLGAAPGAGASSTVFGPMGLGGALAVLVRRRRSKRRL